jgi:hypothetical protein
MRPLDRPEWNFSDEACKTLQFILGALGHMEIAVPVQSTNLLECCAAKAWLCRYDSKISGKDSSNRRRFTGAIREWRATFWE